MGVLKAVGYAALARLRDFKDQDETKGSSVWHAFAGAAVFAPDLGRLTALTALRCGFGKDCVGTCVRQWVAMAVISICGVMCVWVLLLSNVCKSSLSNNSIKAAGASALAPHLGGLTALQTLE